MQIIVLGAQRSGSSLVTRLINMMGASFDAGEPSNKAGLSNPKGFWENRNAVECNNKILEHFSCEWDNLAGWKIVAKPSKKDLAELEKITNNIKKIIAEANVNLTWVMKDTRLCLTFPYWKEHLQNPIIVLCYRDPIETAISLKKSKHFSIAHGLAIWEYYNICALNATKGMTVIRVAHKDLVNNPVKTTSKLYEELLEKNVRGLKLPDKSAIEQFVKKELYRSKAASEDIEAMKTELHNKIWNMVRGKEKIPTKLLHPSEISKDAMENYAKYKKNENKIVELNKKIATIEQENNELASEINEANNMIEELQSERIRAARLQDELNMIKSTIGWKATSRISRIFGIKTREEDDYIKA